METDLPARRASGDTRQADSIPVRRVLGSPSGRAGIASALAVGPALAAVWLVPGFVTQDGPAHLYNAQILAASLGEDSPYAAAYEVSWSPVPNWAGHLLLMGLMSAGASPWLADRVVMTATLAGLAAATLWLRWRVRGRSGLPTAALISGLLAINLTWLLGFSSFLLGACLFPITLGVWWAGRERPGPSWAATLGLLLIAGYFAHIVSLGLTAVGLMTLATLTPAQVTTWRRRWAWTLAGLAPLLPMGLLYHAIASGGGPIRPLWMEFDDPTALSSWWTRLVWVDPLTLGSKVAAPFVERRWAGFAVLAPVLWAAVGLSALAAATAARALGAGGSVDGRASLRDLRGWAILAGILIVGGLVGPDTLGEEHGNYLSQRVVLMGLIAMLPMLELWPVDRFGRIGAASLAVAVALQSAFVWDYALRSHRAVADILEARSSIGRGERVGALVLDLDPAFRANPLRHAGTFLGLGTGGIVWSNYEAAHYYFPVRVREDVEHPPVLAFEEVSILDDPAAKGERRRAWEHLLGRYHAVIDVLVVRGEDPEGLDAITARWFEPAGRVGPVRVLRNRDAARPLPRRSERLARFGPPW